MSSPRVLITNDDGIDAPGLRWLARAAADHGCDVVVAAPAEEASGISAAVTAVVSEGRVPIERRSLPTLEGIPAFAVKASPGYIVTLDQPQRAGPSRRGGARPARAELAQFGQVQMTIAEASEDSVQMSLAEEEAQPEPGTDLALLSEGWATVTAIRTITADESVELSLADEGTA